MRWLGEIPGTHRVEEEALRLISAHMCAFVHACVCTHQINVYKIINIQISKEIVTWARPRLSTVVPCRSEL